MSQLKRKRPDSNSVADSLTEHERVVYDAIRSKQEMGISQRDLKREINLLDKLASKSLKSLQDKNLVRLVPNFQSKGMKHYIAAEFNPSTEITGGAWYTDGSLDSDFIGVLKATCLKFVPNLKVATLEGFVEAVKKSRVSQVELSKKQIEELVESLVCDNELMKVKSTGIGEFASIPVGKVCYKRIDKGNRVSGTMASIPCGVCPQISICTPDGIVSPKTCVYYNTWLDF
ncbi:hypothetical protein SLEP1_g35844 [Rubroshorea leprosula]|uniref:DNA-directed RNA polymerase III subunit RPC6 n=1 Tax=Rubroshorea leprosula TaxID=152421 RepID=A0AAV5KPU8_9ROSI|nr:hypothetical protein SLEP1_g35844 [Rubroshorea leprosula]